MGNVQVTACLTAKHDALFSLLSCCALSSAPYLLLASCNMAYNTPNMAANKNTSMKEIMIGPSFLLLTFIAIAH